MPASLYSQSTFYMKEKIGGGREEIAPITMHVDFR